MSCWVQTWPSITPFMLFWFQKIYAELNAGLEIVGCRCIKITAFLYFDLTVRLGTFVKLSLTLQNSLILLKLYLNDFTDLLIGTVDTWLMWNLTGGIDGGVYITDVTNARWSWFVNIWCCCLLTHVTQFT